MTINTNDFGNYSPKINQTVRSQSKPVETQNQNIENITNEEKTFFAKLYPENKEDVMNYHFYHKDGKMQGVALGTLFDKRG
jgi:hypothetical protein